MSSTFKYSLVVATDVVRLRDFYSSVLGLPVKFTDGDKWCQLNGGRADVAIASTAEAQPLPSGTTAVYQVEDLSVASQRVVSAGGAVVATRDMGAHGSVATCADVEGNHFQLFASAPKNNAST